MRSDLVAHVCIARCSSGKGTFGPLSHPSLCRPRYRTYSRDAEMRPLLMQGPPALQLHRPHVTPHYMLARAEGCSLAPITRSPTCSSAPIGWRGAPCMNGSIVVCASRSAPDKRAIDTCSFDIGEWGSFWSFVFRYEHTHVHGCTKSDETLCGTAIRPQMYKIYLAKPGGGGELRILIGQLGASLVELCITIDELTRDGTLLSRSCTL
jgi:hypothetical protein